MNFPDAVKSAFNKYATFSGRATRSEYWWWVLFVTIAAMVLSIIDMNVLNSASHPLTSIFYLAILVPSIALAARRLHDIDKSGWWQLLALIPIIGTIILIVWYCTKGSLGPNRFGI